MEFTTKPMLKKVYELYRDHQIDESGLENAVAKKWITTNEAQQIRDAVQNEQK